MKPASYADIRSFVRAALERRDQETDGSTLRPSEYWKYFAQNFAYVLRLADEDLKQIRHHGYHLTADSYQKYFFDQGSLARRLRADYDSLASELGGFRPDEGQSRYGCEIDGRFVSTDLLRYMQVIADLVQADVLSRDRPQRVLEIGGGYGGLAAICMEYNGELTYVICDLEETLFFQAVHLSNRFGFEAVELCEESVPAPGATSPGRFYLLPQHRSHTLVSQRADLAINQQSLQEMTAEQVRAYCELLRHATRYFYSCNLDQQRPHVVEETGLVQNLQGLLDVTFPRIRWQTAPPQGIPKLLSKLSRHGRRRSGDRKLRRVVYET